jgi:excisionase family DNA binding protein
MGNGLDKSIDDLPNVLDVCDIQEFLGLSKTKAYDLVNSKDFHVVKIGRLFKIPKESFSNWFLGQQRRG